MGSRCPARSREPELIRGDAAIVLAVAILRQHAGEPGARHDAVRIRALAALLRRPLTTVAYCLYGASGFRIGDISKAAPVSFGTQAAWTAPCGK